MLNTPPTFRISPNPTPGDFKITSDRALGETVVRIYTMLGVLVSEHIFSKADATSLDLITGRTLAPGSYQVRIETGMMQAEEHLQIYR